MKVIKAKMKGKKPKLKESAEEPEAGVLDLMTRLRASLDQGERKDEKARRLKARRSLEEQAPLGETKISLTGDSRGGTTSPENERSHSTLRVQEETRLFPNG